MAPDRPPDEPRDVESRTFGREQPRRLDPPPPIEHPGLAHARPETGERDDGAARHSGVRILRPPAETEAPSEPVDAPATVDVELDGTPADAAPEPAPDRAARTSVLGVNLTGGVAYLAVVDPPAQPRLDLIDQLRPDWDLDPRDMVGELAERTTSTLRDLGVGSIALARPVRYTNWTYRNAFERVSLETCFLLAAHRLDLEFDSVGTNHAANTVGLPTKGLSDTLRTKLHIERSTGWPDRWPALLVAVAVLLERQGITLRDYATELPRP